MNGCILCTYVGVVSSCRVTITVRSYVHSYTCTFAQKTKYVSWQDICKELIEKVSPQIMLSTHQWISNQYSLLVVVSSM